MSGANMAPTAALTMPSARVDLANAEIGVASEGTVVHVPTIANAAHAAVARHQSYLQPFPG
jgi:hypothetical protein|eukprot:COSAG03_NODE_49_length_16340_cov_8.317653_2_plen_61_part_00